MEQNKTDQFGDRMKQYEQATEIKLMPLIPIIARIDGRSFHTFCRGLEKPYDNKLATMMIDVAKFLAEETNACIAYTQSDEITLAWYSTEPKSKTWFDGRHSKMVSQLAAIATLQFYQRCLQILPNYAHKNPTFDTRVWQVPNTTEGANAFIWRELDATKNSITMATRSVYSDKAIYGKNGKEKQEMLFKKGINWNNYPNFFKRGSYIQKKQVTKKFSSHEIEKLPTKHEARTNPNLEITRSEWQILDMPPLTKVTNREEVIFQGAQPKIKETL